MKEDEYPIRPGEEDCPFYLKTGRCGFGETCRFNHPKFFPIGNCKYSSKCRFKHSKEEDGTEAMRQDQKRQRTESSYGPIPERRTKTIDKQKREIQNNLQDESLMPNIEEQGKRDIERQRKEARLKIEQMRPRVLTNNVDQLREALPDIGIDRKEGDGF